MKKGIKILIGVILVAVIGFGVMVFTMGAQVNGLKNARIDMNQVADGTYTASSNTTLVKVKLSVTVKDHKIEKIDLIKHECGKGEAAEASIQQMIKENTYQVDTVSGATASSKVIQNAVNKALQQGMEE